MPELTSLARTLRDGTHISATVTVPKQMAGQVVTVTADLPLASLGDPTLSLRFSLWRFDPDTASWRHIVGASWVGHQGNKIAPSVQVLGDLIAGQQVRFELSVPVRMRVGAIVSVDPDVMN